MNQSSTFKNPQNIIAIGVTIISLCALIVSLMQTRIMQEERELSREERELSREHARISVWPSLELLLAKGHNTDGSINELYFVLRNVGIGPAIITDVKVTYKGKVANDWWHLLEIQGIPDSISRSFMDRSFNKTIIKIEETIEVLNFLENNSLAQAFYEKYEDVLIEIYYESLYKEKWMHNGKKTIELENFEGLPKEEQFY